MDWCGKQWSKAFQLNCLHTQEGEVVEVLMWLQCLNALIFFDGSNPQQFQLQVSTAKCSYHVSVVSRIPQLNYCEGDLQHCCTFLIPR